MVWQIPDYRYLMPLMPLSKNLCGRIKTTGAGPALSIFLWRSLSLEEGQKGLEKRRWSNRNVTIKLEDALEETDCLQGVVPPPWKRWDQWVLGGHNAVLGPPSYEYCVEEDDNDRQHKLRPPMMHREWRQLWYFPYGCLTMARHDGPWTELGRLPF